ncbi:MAG: hypothetical protein JRI68_29900 [Deltaproteobacteria bacterium]|nr:hypothetical protein [Deltaproteobacteria bacterium]
MRASVLCLVLLAGVSGCSVSVATGASVSVGDADEVGPLNNEPSPGTAAAWLVGARWWPASERVFEKDQQWMIDVMLELSAEPPAGEELVQFELLLDMVYEPVHARPGAPPVVRPVPPDGIHRIKLRQRVDFGSTVQAAPRRYQIPVKLPRRRGFQAGEYWLKVTHLGSGVALGTQQLVVLHGGATPADEG